MIEPGAPSAVSRSSIFDLLSSIFQTHPTCFLTALAPGAFISDSS
jgi:hypothetical protein